MPQGHPHGEVQRCAVVDGRRGETILGAVSASGDVVQVIGAPARRLDWKHTWPGRNLQDYTATVPGGFARVYLTDRGQDGGAWHWTASRSTLIGNGFVDTAEEAARLAEWALLGA